MEVCGERGRRQAQRQLGQRASGRYGLPLTSCPLEFGDLEFIAGGQAGAIPPDGGAVPANEQSVFRALFVGFEVAHVSARGREKVTGRGASIPGLVAVLEAGLATIGAIAAGSLELGKPRHC
jgi:hypothetical protein